MYLLYLDESGAVSDPGQRHFVLAGVSVFERKTHWLEQNLNRIAERFSAGGDPFAVELHGSSMRHGNGLWRGYPRHLREQAICDALTGCVAQERKDNVRLFGVVLDKTKLPGANPVEIAFEQLANRFDLYLRRLHSQGNTQRGIFVLDKSSTESRLQTLAREFKHSGHQWGRTVNFAEVPVFLDSRASRLIQLADLVSFAIYRNFEAGDRQYFDRIKDCFDSEGGVQHGFYTNVR